MTTAKNMEDIDALLEDLGYAENFRKNLRASVRKSKAVYGKDLNEISADPSAFIERWGRGRVTRIPETFETKTQFKTWRKNVRMVLKRAAGVSVQSPLTADWKRLMSLVHQNEGKGKLLGPNSHITVYALAKAVSDIGREPSDLTGEICDRATHALTSEQRKSAQRGIGRLNALIEKAGFLPEFEGLLPTSRLPTLTPLRTKASSWTRNSNNPDAAILWGEFNEIMEFRKYGSDGAVIKDTPPSYSENSISAAENSLNWLLRELNLLGHLEAGQDLSDTITYPNLVLAVNAWIRARKDAKLSTTTSTLHNHVSRLTKLAIDHLDVSTRDAKKMVDLRKNRSVRTKSVGVMSEARNAWIRNFAADPAKQARTHCLPEIWMQKATEILARKARGDAVKPCDLMKAMRMGVAAMQSAILFRASPLRATSMRIVRMRGEGAELDATRLIQDPRLTDLRLNVAPEFIKNGREIDTDADDDLAPVLNWYLTTIRPLWISDHPYGKDHHDSDYLFPGCGDRPMSKSSFARNFKDACLDINFDMEMHQARHVCAYWILSVDSNAWAEVAALLEDDEMTVRAYYAWIDTRKASEAGREKLRKLRAFGNKHALGSFDHAA